MHGSGTRTYKERDPKTLGRDPRIQGSETGACKGAKPAHTRVRAGANPGARPAFTQGRDQRKHGSEARTHPGRDPRKRWSWARTYEGSETVPAQTRERDRRVQRSETEPRPANARGRDRHMQGSETGKYTGARPAHPKGRTARAQDSGLKRDRRLRGARSAHTGERDQVNLPGHGIGHVQINTSL